VKSFFQRASQRIGDWLEAWDNGPALTPEHRAALHQRVDRMEATRQAQIETARRVSETRLAAARAACNKHLN
jgi:hypothetical protein